MAKKFPVKPANPERLCWGCDQYCQSDAMRCGNGSDRTQHPAEIFGENWQKWGSDYPAEQTESKPGQLAAPIKPAD